jgi:hypothetical protein
MTAPVPTLVPIFAIPVAVVPLAESAELNAVLGPLFSSQATETYRDPDLPRDPLCFRSREDLLEWPGEPIEQLKRSLLAGLCAAVKSASGYTEAEFGALRMQARARLTIVRPDGAVPAASAPMASWYACYCVASPRPSPGRADSGALRLYGVRGETSFIDAANWRLREPFSRSHYLWVPVPGRLLAFPASTVHEIALNRTGEDLVLVTVRARFAHAGQVALPAW